MLVKVAAIADFIRVVDSVKFEFHKIVNYIGIKMTEFEVITFSLV